MKPLILLLIVLLPVSVCAQPALKLSPQVNFNLTQTSDNLVKRRALSVKIGDSTKLAFAPSFTVGAWGDECFFKVHFVPPLTILQNAVDTSLLNGKPQLTANYGNKGIHRFYVKPDGDFEWEIKFNAMPDTNIFSFDIETEGLNFYFQPPLTQQEIDSGAERPDSVVNSYAVYHSSKSQNWKFDDGSRFEYKTGKAFHLYRPKITDALKKTAWCSLELDMVENKLTLTIPQSFLDKAIFPVVIGPTIGKTAIGGSFSYWSDFILVANFKDADTGLTNATLDYGYWYNAKSNAVCSQSTFRCFVYVFEGAISCDNGKVRDSTGTGTGSTSTTPRWDSVAFSGANAYGDSTYVASYKAIGWFGGSRTSNCKREYFDVADAGDTRYVNADDMAAKPTLSGCESFSNVYSMYASLSVKGAAAGQVIIIRSE